MRKLGKRGEVSSSMVIFFVVGILVLVVVAYFWIKAAAEGKVYIDKIEQAKIDIAFNTCKGYCQTDAAPNYYCNEPLKIPFTDDAGKKSEIWSSCWEMAEEVVKDKDEKLVKNFPANVEFPDCADIYNCEKGITGKCVADQSKCSSLEILGCKKGTDDSWVADEAACQALSEENCKKEDNACNWELVTN